MCIHIPFWMFADGAQILSVDRTFSNVVEA